MYARPPNMIAETALYPAEDTANSIMTPEEIAQQIEQNLLKDTERMKHFADKKRCERAFSVGDMVYIKLQPYRHTSLSAAVFLASKLLKLHSKYYGPFRVLSNVGTVPYKLMLPEGCKLHDTFHVSQLAS